MDFSETSEGVTPPLWSGSIEGGRRLGTKCGPEWPLCGCVTVGEPQTFPVLWSPHMSSEDGHGPSL